MLAGWAVGGVPESHAHGRDAPILSDLLLHGFATGLATTYRAASTRRLPGTAGALRRGGRYFD